VVVDVGVEKMVPEKKTCNRKDFTRGGKRAKQEQNCTNCSARNARWEGRHEPIHLRM
jgi:hypothetical protein